jgi:hypothetical protein
LKRRLQVRCSGFFEIPGADSEPSTKVAASRIRYTHRSAREYLNQDHVREYLMKKTADTTFCPYLSLLSSSVHHLKILDKPRSRELLWHFVGTALSYAYYFESERGISSVYTRLLLEMDRGMGHHHHCLLKDDQGLWIEKTYLLENIIKSDKGWESMRHSKSHWSNFHPGHDNPSNGKRTCSLW